MKKVYRLMAGVSAVAMVSTPLAAADFGYDMGLQQEAETYGGLYYSIPFQGRTDRETREGNTLGFQVDRSAGGGFEPFDGANGLQNKAMFDLSFDSEFTVNKMLVNGVDAVQLHDRLYQTGGEGGLLGGIGGLVAIAVVVGGAAWAANRDDDDQCPSEGGEGGEASDTTFTDVRSFESDFGDDEVFDCDDEYDDEKLAD